MTRTTTLAQLRRRHRALTEAIAALERCRRASTAPAPGPQQRGKFLQMMIRGAPSSSAGGSEAPEPGQFPEGLAESL